MEKLLVLNAEYQKQLAVINQLTLTQWVALAEKLGVEKNHREHAAKKLAIRKLESEGKL